MIFGMEWNFQQLHWEKLKYRKASGVLRKTSHFTEDTFTPDAQQKKGNKELFVIL
jgi:hypothetical protein